MFSLQNKSVVITGAGSGIGKAVALLFAKQGAEVHIVDLNAEQANTTAAEINQAGGTAIVHTCNVADQKTLTEELNTIPSIDILVNSAGVSHIGKADNTSEGDFDRLY